MHSDNPSTMSSDIDRYAEEDDEQSQAASQSQLDREEESPEDKEAPPVNISRVPLKLVSDLLSCMSRPQYKRSCGISSLVSIFNYQFSTMGMGKLPPISMEETLIKLNLIGQGSIGERLKKKMSRDNKHMKCEELGQEAESNRPSAPVNEKEEDWNKSLHQLINEIDFGCFTGNGTLLRWYRVLCRIFGVTGRAYYFYKTSGSLKTDKTQRQAKEQYVEKLVEGKTCFIYHAHDHYFCPVGYEIIPKGDYNEFEDCSSDLIGDSDMWMLIGEPSKCFPIFHTANWKEVQMDLTTYFPNTYNIRRKQHGVRKYKQSELGKFGKTINCLLAFEKIKD